MSLSAGRYFCTFVMYLDFFYKAGTLQSAIKQNSSCKICCKMTVQRAATTLLKKEEKRTKVPVVLLPGDTWFEKYRNWKKT